MDLSFGLHHQRLQHDSTGEGRFGAVDRIGVLAIRLHQILLHYRLYQIPLLQDFHRHSAMRQEQDHHWSVSDSGTCHMTRMRRQPLTATTGQVHLPKASIVKDGKADQTYGFQIEPSLFLFIWGPRKSDGEETRVSWKRVRGLWCLKTVGFSSFIILSFIYIVACFSLAKFGF